MPTGFTAQPWRRPIMLIAAWLVVLQAFLIGVATAQAGAMLASSPLAAATICHAGGDDTSAPDPKKVWHLCCTYCGSAAPAFAPPWAPNVAISEPRTGALLSVLASFAVIIVRAAVRAGPSQAPPSQA